MEYFLTPNCTSAKFFSNIPLASNGNLATGYPHLGYANDLMDNPNF